MARAAPFRKTLNLPKTSFPLRSKPLESAQTLNKAQVPQPYQNPILDPSEKPWRRISELPMNPESNHPDTILINRVLKDIILRSQKNMGQLTQINPLWLQEAPPSLVTLLNQLSLVAPNQPWPTTSQIDFHTQVIELFKKWREGGQVYRAAKPVPWSTKLKTILEKDQIEYRDHLWTSHFLKFPLSKISSDIHPLLNEQKAYLIVWVPAPWTIPAITGIAIKGNFSYVLAEVEGKIYIFAEGLIDHVRKILNLGEDRLLARLPGKVLTQCDTLHPLTHQTIPIIESERIPLDRGSGILSLAPGMDKADFEVSRSQNLKISCPVDEAGCFTDDCGFSPLIGKKILEQQDAIGEALRETGTFLLSEEHTYPYPYCQESGSPVVFRAIPRFYFNISSKDFKSRAIDELRRMSWRPESEKESLIEDLKGLKDPPISKPGGEGIFIPEAPEDTFASWPILVAATSSQQTSNIKNLSTDLFLENRNDGIKFLPYWLIARLVTETPRPRPLVILHGLAQSDAADSNDSYKKYFGDSGIEEWRLWIAASDLHKDFKLNSTTAVQIQGSYQKFRRTLRYLLGNLDDFSLKQHWVPYENREPVDRWILADLEKQKLILIQSYQEMSTHHVYQRLHQWISNVLSSFYLEVIKDKLYFSHHSDFKKFSAQSTLFDIVTTLILFSEPILPAMAEEAEAHLISNLHVENIGNHQSWQPNLNWRVPQDLALEIDKIRMLRGEVFKGLEMARQKKIIKHPRDAQIRITGDKDWIKFLQDHSMTWPNFFRVSQVVVTYELPEKAWASEKISGLQVEVVPAEGNSCERCRLHSTTVGKNLQYSTLCQRCSDVLTRT